MRLLQDLQTGCRAGCGVQGVPQSASLGRQAPAWEQGNAGLGCGPVGGQDP